MLNENLSCDETSCTNDGVICLAEMDYSESSDVADGLCTCVCISDEGCCGCIMQ
jgi:hypothetical protein